MTDALITPAASIAQNTAQAGSSALQPPNFQTLPLNTPEALLAAVRALQAYVEAGSAEICRRWAETQPGTTRRAFRISQRNLADYLVLRRVDLRPLQTALQPYGVSSLGRGESRVREQLAATRSALEAITGEPPTTPPPNPQAFFRGDRILRRNTDEVFGPFQVAALHEDAGNPEYSSPVRIMVTFPTEAGDDYNLVRELVRRGMDAARINCAHDSPEVWANMIDHIRRAEEEFDHPVLIHMDLAGPKSRTGEVVAPKGTPLMVGDTLLLTRAEPVKPKKKNTDKERDNSLPRHQVQIAIPAILDQLQEGGEIWFDDGLMATKIEKLDETGAWLRVQQVGPKGYKLKPEKGLNFPGADLTLTPLDGDDLAALDFICTHADSVGYSFVQTADDVRLLQQEIASRIQIASPTRRRRTGQTALTIIAKIETARAVRELPNIINAGASAGPFAVMIARGDLAVEIGFERMAEIQEELLWLCEAAHIPVIWATQVLERFVKEGTPSRGEMTDAALAVRAESVMLNKGPFVAEAVTILDSLMIRMSAHLRKKTPQLRALRSWSSLME